MPGPAEPDASLLVLPTEPEPRTVDELRGEAEQVVADLLQQHPDSPSAHRAAATLYQTLNQYERVTEHWEKCVALDPTDPVARVWLAKVQMKKGADDAAEQTLKAAREAGLQTAEIHCQYAVVMQRKGRLEEAERIASQALRTYEENRDLWITLGQAQVQSGKHAQAKDSFEAALKIDPKSTAARVALANACQRLGDKEAADEHRRQAEQVLAQRRRDDLPFDEDYEQTLRLTVATVLSSAATLLDDVGNATEAERLCQRAYAIHPGYPDSYRQLANMYYRDGKLERAVVVQQRLAQLEPENDANHVNLASLLFRLGRMSDGEAVLLSAARAAPAKAIFPQTLATVFLHSGQLPRARQCAEQAARLEPTPQRWRLLAEICRQQGDLAAADVAAAAAAEFASPLKQEAKSP